MQMTISRCDIYDIIIDDIELESNNIGYTDGFENFDINIDEVHSNADKIIINISGTCRTNNYNDYPFTGQLEMDSNEFTYEYTNAAEDGNNYIEFDGYICINIDTSTTDFVDERDIDQTFDSTILNIQRSYIQDFDDQGLNYTLLDSIINNMNLYRVINVIKKIDNVEIADHNDLYNYLTDNVFTDSYGSISNQKYIEIESILLDELKNLIINNKVNEIIVNIIKDYINDNCCDITAKVFFSDLNL